MASGCVRQITSSSARKCPFISNLSPSFLKNHGNALIKTFADKCPFMRNYASAADSGNVDSVASKCPFMKEMQPSVKAASTEIQNDIFESSIIRNKESKSFQYEDFFLQKIKEKKENHTYRIFKKINRNVNDLPYAEAYNEKYKSTQINWSSNDYLGMSGHPAVMKAFIDATRVHGVGSGGTRNISGNSPAHEELEEELASLHQKEAALVFTSCYSANHSSLYTLGKHLPQCHIFSDAGNHASMIQGIRDSGVPKYIFKHNDPVDLEKKLQAVDFNFPKIVVFETVHSMSGAVCPLEDLCDVAHKYGAITFIDEVHAVGLYGENGAGIGEQAGILDKMDIISGTFGKAYGAIGGYIASTNAIVDFVRSYAAGFIFTTSLPIPLMRATLTAVKLLRSNEGRRLRAKQQQNVKYLRRSLQEVGIPVVDCPSHIIPIHVGNAKYCTELCEELLTKYGHYVQSINYPTVAVGEEKLRLAPTPFHTKHHMDMFVANIVEAWENIGLDFCHHFCSQEFCRKPLFTGNATPCGGVVGCPQIAVH